MTWSTVLAALLSAMQGALIGGLLAHRLTLRREVLSAQRTQRVAFLLDAYRKLSNAANRPRLEPEHVDNLESAVHDIMLLGGREEIDAAHRFIIEQSQHGKSRVDPVMFALRDSLRSELDLDHVPIPKPFDIRFVRR